MFNVASWSRVSRKVSAVVAAVLMSAPVLNAVTHPAAAKPTTTPRAAQTQAVGTLKVPVGLPRAIEPLATYVPQDSCRPSFLPGTAKLGAMLVATYKGTSFQGAYACGTDSARSEHYEGRAIDWMNSVRNPAQKAQAASVLNFLLGTDKAGNTFANARRLGVMYIIWNNNIWGAWNGRWAPYNNCAKTPAVSSDNACHRNHMHISLSWNGAYARTSFWTKRVYATSDYGPCRPRDLNWAAGYTALNTKGCPSYPAVAAPAKASAADVALVKYSGAAMTAGTIGNQVKALQQAFGIAVTGHFDTRTASLAKYFKRVHHAGDARTPLIDAATWRALLAAYRPH